MTKAGRKIWAQLAPPLTAMKVLTVVDVFSFARYCDLMARWIELKAVRDERGIAGWSHKSGKNGHVTILPQGVEERQLLEELRQLEGRFGLDPSSRTRVRVDQTSPATPAVPVPATDDRMSFFRQGGPAKPGDRAPIIGA